MVRYFIRSPIRWSLVCSFAWLAGPSLSRTHTRGGECVNFQPFFPIFNGSLRAWLDDKFGVWGICGVANIRLQCTYCVWKTTGDAIVQPAQHRKCKTWIVEKEAMRRCERKKIDFTQTIEHLHKIFIKYVNVWMHEYTTWCPFFRPYFYASDTALLLLSPSSEVSLMSQSIYNQFRKIQFDKPNLIQSLLTWTFAVNISCICISIIISMR